jgi:hypothetical protein
MKTTSLACIALDLFNNGSQFRKTADKNDLHSITLGLLLAPPTNRALPWTAISAIPASGALQR